ncbi:leukocyte receptor cluster member 1 [Heterodontus francisci]|uniref:leukocyte receptor cluster member 1 n=1 Tax=Heterodontus francisci TaxID=7792 RepID=UPI00355B52C4
MNILPKKSWHVRNKDNVARVRRDEERAAAAEQDVQRRVALAEQEARTDFLRSRARLSLPETQQESLAITATDGTPRNLNLFSEIEEGKKQKSGSKEYEAEKRQEKEKHERALGLLTYLGQSSSEAQTSKPWYQHAPGRRGLEEGERDARLKRQMDPLLLVNKLLRQGGKARKKGRDGGPGEAGRRSGEGLRAERLRREAVERARAEALLAGRGGEPRETEADDRKRPYNSQFHPHLSRKKRRGDWR